MEELLKKLSEKERLSVIQKRYHKTEKGKAKVERNNERRRFKTLYNRVLRELYFLTELKRIEINPVFQYILRK